MSSWTNLNSTGQGHSLTLVQGDSDSTFANFFSLETAKLTEAKFHVAAPWDRGTKVCSNGPGQMTNMVMPIYGKNLKNLLLWNQKADDLESCYVASGAQVLPRLFQLWPWADLDLFYSKVKFGLRNPRVLLALVQTLLTCEFHLKSLVIVTPRYLMLSTFSRSVPSKVYEAWIFLIRFLVSCIILHLTGWNLLPHFLAQEPNRSISLWSFIVSSSFLISR